MFKKVLALTLAAVMLLMPMTASAVTWNKLVAGLHEAQAASSGYSAFYSEDDVKASISWDDGEDSSASISVTGGKVEFVHYTDKWGYSRYDFLDSWSSEIGEPFDYTYYSFSDVELDTSEVGDYLDIYAFDGNFVGVYLDKGVEGVKYGWLGTGRDGAVDLWLGEGTTPLEHVAAWFEDNTGRATLITDEVNAVGEIYAGYTIKSENRLTADEAVASLATLAENFSVFGPDDDQTPIYVSADFFDENGFYDYVVLEYNRSTGEYELIYLDSEDRVDEDDDEEEEEEPEPEPDPIELQRQAEGIGGVTTSPVWNWQGYLGHSSKPMWIYVNGEKVLMRQRLFWLGDSTKNHTCRINVAEPDPASIELRVGLDMLRTAQRAEISVISVLDKDSNPIAQFAVSDLLGAFEQYGLEEGELLCVSADPDAEVMKVTLDGEYLPLEEAEEENAAA